MKATLTNADLARELDLSRSTIDRLEKRGELRRFALSQPFGQHKWSGRLVEKCLEGESLVAFGRGARLLKKGA